MKKPAKNSAGAALGTSVRIHPAPRPANHPRQRQLVASDEAVRTPRQHTQPCADCPWRRTSLKGWLGGATPQQWLRAAHGDARIDCHTQKPWQCAGAAIYRANVCKRLVNPNLLVLPVDEKACFDSPMEFEAHHAKKK